MLINGHRLVKVSFNTGLSDCSVLVVAVLVAVVLEPLCSQTPAEVLPGLVLCIDLDVGRRWLRLVTQS